MELLLDYIDLRLTFNRTPSQTVNFIYNEHIYPYLIKNLWLCSLERIKDNIDCKEKDSGMSRKETQLDRLDNDQNFLKNKEEELLEFAKQKNLKCNESTLLEITKGKFALWFFVRKYLRALKKLPKFCKNKSLVQVEMCDYCKVGDNNNCSYIMEYKLTGTKDYEYDRYIEFEIKKLTNLSSLIPIKQRIQQLK